MISTDCIFGQFFYNGCCYDTNGSPDPKCVSNSPKILPFEVVGSPGNSWIQPSGTPGQPSATLAQQVYPYSPSYVTPVVPITGNTSIPASSSTVVTPNPQTQAQQQATTSGATGTGTTPVGSNVIASSPFNWTEILIVGGLGIAALFLFKGEEN